MKTQHTPRPWRYDPKWSLIMGPNEVEIAAIHAATFPQEKRLLPDTARANAEYIVKACNSHEDLVSACTAFLKEWENPLKEDFKDSPLATVADLCTKALAKVGK